MAATTRTSTRWVRLLPRRSNSCSCNTRSSLGCKLERNIGHFIEEEGAAIGKFKAADFLRERAGESAAFVAKQFRFQKAGRNGSAIDFDESALAARAQIVNGAGDEFLAGAGFAEDQHGGARRRGQFHLGKALRKAGLSPMISSKLNSVRISSSR